MPYAGPSRPHDSHFVQRPVRPVIPANSPSNGSKPVQMLGGKANYPEAGEYIIGTIKKIVPYGAFVGLDEYPAQDAFLHISEVSSGWIRNIREHIKENQKVVVLVTRVDADKQQIDVSLKKVSDADRKRKLESRQMEKRADKLLERAALRLNKTLPMAQREIAPLLVKEFGDLYSAFEALSKQEVPADKIPAPWLTALLEVAKAEIKEKIVKVRATMKLECYSENGVSKLRTLLSSIVANSKGKVVVEVHYLGAPQYFVDVTAPDFKIADKTLSKVESLLSDSAGKDFEYSFERQKN